MLPNSSRLTAPCMECPTRTAECHGGCARYAEYKAQVEALSEQRKRGMYCDNAKMTVIKSEMRKGTREAISLRARGKRR